MDRKELEVKVYDNIPKIACNFKVKEVLGELRIDPKCYALVVGTADTVDSKPTAFGRTGSSPV